MRILLAAGSLPPHRCGVGTYTGDLARGLAAVPGVSVAVLTAAGGEEDAGYELLYPRHGWSLRGALQIVRQIRRWRPDVAHFQYPAHGYGPHPLPWLLPWMARLMGIRIAISWHEYHRRLHLIDLPNALVPGGLVVARPRFLERLSPLYRRLIRHKKFRQIAVASSIPGVELTPEKRAALRRSFAAETARMIAYFGFVYDHKGVEDLFTIADPATDVLVLVAELHDDDEYQRHIAALVSSPRWSGRAFVTGYLPPVEVAEVLAAADAAVFPFRHGCGPWNTSLPAAAAQGTFVVTTSTERRGYDPEQHIHYAAPGDLDGIRQALRERAGQRVPAKDAFRRAEWKRIVDAHLDLYRELVA